VNDGTPARPASEVERAEAAVSLEFRYPNLWQIRLGDDLRNLLAFVPVDESNTVIYLVYAQRIAPLPVLGRIFAWLGKLGSIVILRQDKRVVREQRPVASALRMDEQLIVGDRPIVEYRKRRDALLRGDNGKVV